MTGKKIITAIVVVLALCFLTGCGDDSEEEGGGGPLEPPAEYTIGEELIEALTPSDGAAITELVIDEETGISRYVYDGFGMPGAKAALYSRHMVSDNGFSVVGDDYRSAEEPDFTAESGNVKLSRPTGESQILLLSIDWGEKSCSVTTSVEAAPPPEVKAQSAASRSLSHEEIEDFIKGLSPSVLELEGSSMSHYNVCIENGLVTINDDACIRVTVYSSENDIHTNELCGIYYLTRDSSHVYKLAENQESVYELDVK